jgi:hypothetical protein
MPMLKMLRTVRQPETPPSIPVRVEYKVVIRTMAMIMMTIWLHCSVALIDKIGAWRLPPRLARSTTSGAVVVGDDENHVLSAADIAVVRVHAYTTYLDSQNTLVGIFFAVAFVGVVVVIMCRLTVEQKYFHPRQSHCDRYHYPYC